MNAFADPRRKFGHDSLATASGPKVVVMCYDRIDRDLAQAIEVLGGRDVQAAHTCLVHAQDLITELMLMLDVEAWEHARALASVYDYLVRLLTAANATKKISKVEEAQRLVKELGDAFRGAAAEVLAGAPATRVAAAAATTAPAATAPAESLAAGFSFKA